MLLKRFLLSATVSIPLLAQTPAADPSKVVATVAGKDITAGDILQMLSTFSAQSVQAFQQNPQSFVGQYFMMLHLADEAEKAKLLEKSPYKEQFEAVRRQIQAQARVNEENNAFTVTPEMIDSYYKQHSAQYEQARIKVISISFGGGQPVVTGTGIDALQAAAKAALAAGQGKRSEADARKLADDIVKQLRGGADFAKLVEQYSEDATSKAAGGDFPPIKAVSEFPPELKTAVFALKPGEIGEPLRQPAAFYIIRLEAKSTQPVDEVREPIVQTLRNDHMNQWMKDMNAGFQAVIKDPDYFKTLGAPALPGLPPAAPKQ
jgi:peptidyl-prolyl cis-trans isomerase C